MQNNTHTHTQKKPPTKLSLQYNTINEIRQYHILRHNTTQHNTLQHNATQSTLKLQYNTIQYNTQHNKIT